MSDLSLGLILGLLIAIPLAWLIDAFRRARQVHKMFKPLREIVPNIVPADGFKLHEVPSVVRKPRKRPSNVTALKPGPKEAA